MKRDKYRPARIKAVELAAQVLAARQDLEICPHAWCLSVFFESYIEHGSAGTQKDFGPKKPTKLKTA